MSDDHRRNYYDGTRWVHTEAEKNSETPERGHPSPLSSALSLKSKLLMALAILQAVVVLGLQISMAVIGYQNGTHVDFCLSQAEQRLLDCVNNISGNSTSNLFGDDKFIYIIFFIGLTFYNLVLCIYSLKQQDRVEVFAFIITNTLTLLYAALQVYQFRGYGGQCEALSTIGWIAVANVVILSVFTPLFYILSAMIYFEFGWKIYKQGSLMSTDIRNYFHWYELFISGVKLVLLFTIIFGIAEVVLLLPPKDPEFGLTIVLLIAMMVVCVLVHILVQKEYLWAYVCITLLGVLLIAYYAFKVGRFASHTCPLCRLLDNRNTQNQTLISICSNMTNGTLPMARLDELTNLLIISLLNFITTIVVFIMFIKVWCNRGKGLKDHFAAHPSGPFRVIRAVQSYCTRRADDGGSGVRHKEQSPLMLNTYK